MSETTTTESSTYDKLTPQRKTLIDQVMQNLENGDGLWTPGWKMSGVPESAITGKQYRGVNNFYLTIVSMMKGYSDNRWVTFNQMEEKGWTFKTDEEGKSLGKGAGVTIEFFEFRDRETKQRFDRHTLDGMTDEERQEYMKDNVYPVRRYYRVFNGDIIEGIPQKEEQVLDPSGKVERAERILDYWNENEAKIIYGGNQAYYKPSTDEVHLPPREAFLDMAEFYSTAMHEVGHSTGHSSRLNRDLSSGFGSAGYAQEELKAEIASLFMEQDLNISVSEKHIENNSKYIKNWLEIIKENPNALFTAITDADKIAKYVVDKERLASSKKNTEYFAIVPKENEYGDTVYTVYMAEQYGQTRPAIAYAFSSREALMAEFDKFQEAPFWKDKTFEEVSFEELQAKSIERFEAEQAAEEKADKQGESGEIYLPPSQIAARGLSQTSKADMTGRGVESLTRMSDRELVERAKKTSGGEKFSTLYEGGTLFGNDEKDARSMMVRIAAFTTDEQQLLRIFKSSGQFKDENPNSLYEKITKESLAFAARIRQKETQPIMDTGKRRAGLNSKT